MPGENDDNLELETPNEGLEAEADAAGADLEGDEDGAEPEGSAEGDGADAEEGQAVDGEPPQRRPTRGEQRFQTLSRTAREANERATRLETELRQVREEVARSRPQPEQPRGKSPEELALMTPDELITYRLGESDKRFQQHLGQIQWATYEQGDKAAFNALKVSDPLAAKYADEVETRLAAMRQQGQNVDRERLLTYIIGEKARQGRTAAKVKQAGEGQRRIQRQQTRPGASQRSDTPSNRGKMSEQEAREKRLENLTF